MVSEQVEGIGKADPIKSHFYDYVRNEHKGGMNQADKFLPKRFFIQNHLSKWNSTLLTRCKVCRGCLTTPCRPVAKVRCDACLRFEQPAKVLHYSHEPCCVCDLF